jgi:hypothetical protein
LTFADYYIKQIASRVHRVHGHFKMAHEILQNYAIVDALAINGIIKDFELGAGGDMSKALGLMSFGMYIQCVKDLLLTENGLGFWLGGSVFGFNPLAGGILNAVSALFRVSGLIVEVLMLKLIITPLYIRSNAIPSVAGTRLWSAEDRHGRISLGHVYSNRREAWKAITKTNRFQLGRQNT